MVVLVTAGAYVLAALGQGAYVPANIGPFLLVLLAAILATNLATRRFVPDADGMLLPIAALLNGVGYVMIARLNPDLAGFQALWSGVGMLAFVGVLIFLPKVRDLANYRYIAMVVGLGLLMMPMIPGLGIDQNGSQIWVRLGPLRFQPGEFAKVALAVFFAGYLVEKRELLAMRTRRLGPLMVPDPKHFGPVLLAWGVSLLVMVRQTDLGSSLLFFALFLVMLWVATERPSYVAMGVAMFGVGAYVAFRSFGHVRGRVDAWLDPYQDPLGRCCQQILQSGFAMADGGIAGTGLGASGSFDFFAKESDFIFVFIGQDLGLLGATAVMLCYVLIVGSGLRIAIRADNNFDKLLATGLSSLIGFQAFIIMAGVTRLLPLTGITLPFVSYGGSSLVSNYVIIAVLLRISHESAQRSTARQTVSAGAVA